MTLSPVSTRMRFLRILPAVWAMISWPFCSCTRKVALGSNSLTMPSNSRSSSFAIRPLAGLVARQMPLEAAEIKLIRPPIDPKPGGDAGFQRVPQVAVGVETLVTAAFDQGGILGRPIFDERRRSPGQLHCPMMRLRRQRDDEVEGRVLHVIE